VQKISKLHDSTSYTIKFPSSMQLLWKRRW
jgi:hypothetical protein